jgi:hypothetical protein
VSEGTGYSRLLRVRIDRSVQTVPQSVTATHRLVTRELSRSRAVGRLSGPSRESSDTRSKSNFQDAVLYSRVRDEGERTEHLPGSQIEVSLHNHTSIYSEQSLERSVPGRENADGNQFIPAVP